MIELRRVPDLWRRCDVMVRDLPLALLLGLASLIPALHNRGTQLGNLPGRPFEALTVVVLMLECLPLIVRRRSPTLCLAVVFLGFAVDQSQGYHTVAGTALPIALLSVAARLEHHRRTTVILTTAAYLVLAVLLDRRGSTEGVSGFVTFYLALTIAWGVGAWLRQNRMAEVQRRLHVAEATRVAERTRIARELHDVVTHHVTAMVVQAEAARYLTSTPQRLEQALTAVTDTGRRAVSDLRELLDVLNPEYDTGFGTARVGEFGVLVEQTRLAGQPVDFTEDGIMNDSTGTGQAAAYRVVQESLTNALKYAYGSHTAVHVHHGRTETIVRVVTDGAGEQRIRTDAVHRGSGRGLAGLRERVGLLGGEFSAGRQPGGDFVVHAIIPSGNPS